jgi:hypothetical protein
MMILQVSYSLKLYFGAAKETIMKKVYNKIFDTVEAKWKFMGLNQRGYDEFFESVKDICRSAR